MKKLKLTFLFFVGLVSASNSIYGQKTATLSDQSKVQYALNGEGKLNGAYVVYQDDNKVFLRGSYKDNARAGNWYAFNNDGNVFLRYNYDLKKLVFIDTTSVGRINVDVKSSDKDVKDRASISFPILSVDQYISLLGSEFRRLLLAENKDAYGALDVDLVASVDDKGRASYQALYEANGVKVAKTLKVAQKAFDIEWVPASLDGKTYASTFSVKSRIDFSSTIPGKQRFVWVY